MIGTRSSLMHYIYIITFVSSISCSANGLHDVTTPCDDLCYISKVDRAWRNYCWGWVFCIIHFNLSILLRTQTKLSFFKSLTLHIPGNVQTHHFKKKTTSIFDITIVLASTNGHWFNIIIYIDVLLYIHACTGKSILIYSCSDFSLFTTFKTNYEQFSESIFETVKGIDLWVIKFKWWTKM